jgi:membrane peptidoglycan carboxypeptidase
VPHVDQHIVLAPNLDAQVQYAMEQTTIDGTAAQTVTYGQQTPGTVIGKTGTTTNSHSGFFIGATSQYSLVVGMFTSSQDTNSNDNLSALGGGGFGGYWPAKIWNTFAQEAFSKTPTVFPTNPAFTGAAWNQVGKLATPKPTVNCMINGHKKKMSRKTCPTPTPTPTCSYDQNGNYSCSGGGTTPTPTPTCSYDQNGNYSCSGGGGTATPTASATCQYQGDPTCNGNTFTGNSSSTPTATGAQAGLAVGGGLMILPGSLLWTTMSRRRRRKKRADTAE